MTIRHTRGALLIDFNDRVNGDTIRRNAGDYGRWNWGVEGWLKLVQRGGGRAWSTD